MVSRPEIATAHQASEGECSNALPAPTMGDVILARFSRREALRGLTAVAALASLAPVGAAAFARNARAGMRRRSTSKRYRTPIPRRTPFRAATGRRR